MRKRSFLYSILVACCLLPAAPGAAQTLELTLDASIRLAVDSSLQAFLAENRYMANYWAYRSYRAGRLPTLSLRTTPLEYRSDFTRRYDSNADIDVYRRQQSLYAYGNLSISQNVDLTGGRFFIDSELAYMRNFTSGNNYSQFTSVPVRVGYAQSLFGFNSFKWDNAIEPLKYRKARVQYLYAREEISETVIQRFFALALARLEREMAAKNVESSESLYRLGQERQKIASISRSDLLTLKLDAVNARNALESAGINLKRAMFSLVSYLHLDKETTVTLELPSRPREVRIDPDLALALAREHNPDFLANQQELLEAEREVDRTRKGSTFDASLSASIGFNQVANDFRGAYQKPLQQDVVSVGLTIPLVDWGVRKGRVNMAINTLNVTRISIQQREESLEQDVVMTVNDFNVQRDLISSAEEALELAVMAYEATRERFIIGKADLNSLTLALNRQDNALRNHLSALKNYWLSYYKLRKLTLFDFLKQEELGIEITEPGR